MLYTLLASIVFYLFKDFEHEALESLQSAVTYAPDPSAAAREAQAWLEIITHRQVSVKEVLLSSAHGGDDMNRGVSGFA